MESAQSCVGVLESRCTNSAGDGGDRGHSSHKDQHHRSRRHKSRRSSGEKGSEDKHLRRHRRHRHHSSKVSGKSRGRHRTSSSADKEHEDRRRRRVALAKKIRGRSTGSRSSSDKVLNCLEKAELLIEQHRKEKQIVRKESRSHSTASKTPEASAAKPQTKTLVGRAAAVAASSANAQESPATKKKATVDRVIQTYPEELRHLFIMDGDEFRDSPKKRNKRSPSEPESGEEQSNNASNDGLPQNVAEAEQLETSSGADNGVHDDSHSQEKQVGDQMLTDIWGATLKESQSVAIQLRQMLTELKTSEEEKQHLREYLAKLEEDTKEKEKMLTAQLKQQEMEKAQMTQKLQHMAKRVEEVEQLEQHEIQHVKFHSSDAESQRRAQLLALETGPTASGRDDAAAPAAATLVVASRKDGHTFVYEGVDFDTNGIVYHIGSQGPEGDTAAGGWQNPGKAGAISVTRSSEGGGEAYHALNHSKGVFPCRTFDAVNSWFCIDFGPGRRIVDPTHYSLRMGPGLDRVLVAWVIEASCDGSTWVCLDDRRRVWKMPMPRPGLSATNRRRTHAHPQSQQRSKFQLENRRFTQPAQPRALKNQWHWPLGVHTEESAEQEYATGTWPVQKVKKTREELRQEAKAQMAGSKADHKATSAAQLRAYRYFRIRNAYPDDGATSASGTSRARSRSRSRSSSSGVGSSSNGMDTLNLCGFELYGTLVEVPL